jgi:NADH:ubiquinone oxidoreductase subunit E
LKENTIMGLSDNLIEKNPDLTPEVMIKIEDIIKNHNQGQSSLIPVLTECQEIIGYLPVELQEYIANSMKIPGSDIYGVVTFYSFFTMQPKGGHNIKVCMGTACYVRGIQEIISRVKSEFHIDIGETTEDRRFSLEAVRCLGACGLAPVVVVDSDTHGGVTPDSVLDILKGYE